MHILKAAEFYVPFVKKGDKKNKALKTIAKIFSRAKKFIPNDILVIKLPKELSLRPLKVATTPLRLGHDQVYGIGYPRRSFMDFIMNNDDYYEGFGQWLFSSKILPKYLISRGAMKIKVRNGTKNFAVVRNYVSKGMSGGPLLNNRGEVVGVHSFVMMPDWRKIKSSYTFHAPLTNQILKSLVDINSLVMNKN